MTMENQVAGGARVGASAMKRRSSTHGRTARGKETRFLNVKILYHVLSSPAHPQSPPKPSPTSIYSASPGPSSRQPHMQIPSSPASPRKQIKSRPPYFVRLPDPIKVEIVGDRVARDRHGVQFGRVKVKECLRAVCLSRPELVIDQSKDYTIHALDSHESWLRSKSSSSSTAAASSFISAFSRNRTTNASSSPSREPGAQHEVGEDGSGIGTGTGAGLMMEGKGLLSWCLAEEGQGRSWIVGKILGGMRDGDRQGREGEGTFRVKEEEEEEGTEGMPLVLGDEDEDEGMSGGGREEEDDDDDGDEGTLEVYLQLTERKALAQTQTQFLLSLGSLSKPTLTASSTPSTSTSSSSSASITSGTKRKRSTPPSSSSFHSPPQSSRPATTTEIPIIVTEYSDNEGEGGEGGLGRGDPVKRLRSPRAYKTPTSDPSSRSNLSAISHNPFQQATVTTTTTATANRRTHLHPNRNQNQKVDRDRSNEMSPSLDERNTTNSLMNLAPQIMDLLKTLLPQQQQQQQQTPAPTPGLFLAGLGLLPSKAPSSPSTSLPSSSADQALAGLSGLSKEDLREILPAVKTLAMFYGIGGLDGEGSGEGFGLGISGAGGNEATKDDYHDQDYHETSDRGEEGEDEERDGLEDLPPPSMTRTSKAKRIEKAPFAASLATTTTKSAAVIAKSGRSFDRFDSSSSTSSSTSSFGGFNPKPSSASLLSSSTAGVGIGANDKGSKKKALATTTVAAASVPGLGDKAPVARTIHGSSKSKFGSTAKVFGEGPGFAPVSKKKTTAVVEKGKGRTDAAGGSGVTSSTMGMDEGSDDEDDLDDEERKDHNPFRMNRGNQPRRTSTSIVKKASAGSGVAGSGTGKQRVQPKVQAKSQVQSQEIKTWDSYEPESGGEDEFEEEPASVVGRSGNDKKRGRNDGEGEGGQKKVSKRKKGKYWFKGCGNCSVKKSTAWRVQKGSGATEENENVEKLCNACGVYYNRRGTHRPIEARTNTNDRALTYEEQLARIELNLHKAKASDPAPSSSTFSPSFGGKFSKIAVKRLKDGIITSPTRRDGLGPIRTASLPPVEKDGHLDREAATSPFRVGKGSRARVSPKRKGGFLSDGDDGTEAAGGDDALDSVFDFLRSTSPTPNSPTPRKKRMTSAGTSGTSAFTALNSSPGTALNKLLAEADLDLNGLESLVGRSRDQESSAPPTTDLETLFSEIDASIEASKKRMAPSSARGQGRHPRSTSSVFTAASSPPASACSPLVLPSKNPFDSDTPMSLSDLSVNDGRTPAASADAPEAEADFDFDMAALLTSSSPERGRMGFRSSPPRSLRMQTSSRRRFLVPSSSSATSASSTTKRLEFASDAFSELDLDALPPSSPPPLPEHLFPAGYSSTGEDDVGVTHESAVTGGEEDGVTPLSGFAMDEEEEMTLQAILNEPVETSGGFKDSDWEGLLRGPVEASVPETETTGAPNLDLKTLQDLGLDPAVVAQVMAAIANGGARKEVAAMEDGAHDSPLAGLFTPPADQVQSPSSL